MTTVVGLWSDCRAVNETGLAMVEVPPEIKNVTKQQEASLQRIAMWVIGLPRENRAAAINLARKVFEETFQQASLHPELA